MSDDLGPGESLITRFRDPDLQSPLPVLGCNITSATFDAVWLSLTASMSYSTASLSPPYLSYSKGIYPAGHSNLGFAVVTVTTGLHSTMHKLPIKTVDPSGLTKRMIDLIDTPAVCPGMMKARF